MSISKSSTHIENLIAKAKAGNDLSREGNY